MAVLTKSDWVKAVCINDDVSTRSGYEVVSRQLGLGPDVLNQAAELGHQRTLDEYRAGRFLGLPWTNFTDPLDKLSSSLRFEAKGMAYVGDQRCLRIIMAGRGQNPNVPTFTRVELSAEERGAMSFLFMCWLDGAVTALRGPEAITELLKYTPVLPKRHSVMRVAWLDGCAAALRASANLFAGGQRRFRPDKPD